MELTNIKENIAAPSLQETIPGISKRQGPPKERASSHEVTEEFLKKVSDGDEEALKVVSETFDRLTANMRFNLQFVVDREASGVVIKVIDTEGNLIRRIPPETMSAFSSEMGVDIGLLLNTEL